MSPCSAFSCGCGLRSLPLGASPAPDLSAGEAAGQPYFQCAHSPGAGGAGRYKKPHRLTRFLKTDAPYTAARCLSIALTGSNTLGWIRSDSYALVAAQHPPDRRLRVGPLDGLLGPLDRLKAGAQPTPIGEQQAICTTPDSD